MKKQLQTLINIFTGMETDKALCWTIPSTNAVDLFDVELTPFNDTLSWRYKSSNSTDWIDLESNNIIETFEQNEINLEPFKTTLEHSLYFQASKAHNFLIDAKKYIDF